MIYTFKNRYDYNLKWACSQCNFVTIPQFWELNFKQLLEIWNGIGAAGSAWNILIPSTFYGLNMDLPSLPHDVEYKLGQSEEDRKIADDNYLENMYKLIEQESCWLLKWPRRRRAYKYYLSVRVFGKVAFWEDKVEPSKDK